MPTFYEGAPVAQNTFLISEEDFVKAYGMEKNDRSFFTKKEVKGAILFCLMLIAVFTIPNSVKTYGTFFTQAIFIGICLVFFYLAVFWQPEEIKKSAQKAYRSNCLLQEENTVTVYRDSLIYENRFEKFSQYLTDFNCCMENSEMFVLLGGERNILIIKKEGMEEKQCRLLQEHFSSFFVSAYIRVKRGAK